MIKETDKYNTKTKPCTIYLNFCHMVGTAVSCMFASYSDSNSVITSSSRSSGNSGNENRRHVSSRYTSCCLGSSARNINTWPNLQERQLTKDSSSSIVTIIISRARSNIGGGREESLHEGHQVSPTLLVFTHIPAVQGCPTLRWNNQQCLVCQTVNDCDVTAILNITW